MRGRTRALVSEGVVGLAAATQVLLTAGPGSTFTAALLGLAGGLAWHHRARLRGLAAFVCSASLGGLAMLLGARADAALGLGAAAGHGHHGAALPISLSVAAMLLACTLGPTLLGGGGACGRASGPATLAGLAGMLAGMWLGHATTDGSHAGMVLGMAAGHALGLEAVRGVGRRRGSDVVPAPEGTVS